MEKRLRKWTADGGPSWWCPQKCCAFCDKCQTVFWDYTNGPYLCFCDLDLDPNESGGYAGKCESFVEEDESDAVYAIGVYDTGVVKLVYSTEEELETLKAMYPNDDCPDDLPCPPPPKP